MRAWTAVLRATIRQLLGGKRTVFLGLLALIPAVVTFLATTNTSPSGAFRTFHDAPVAILFLIVLPIASLVLGSAALGDERRDGTLSFLVLRPMRRSAITSAKLAAAWIAAVAVSGFAAAAAAVVVAGRVDDWAMLIPLLVGAALSCAAYTSVFLVLGHLTSRAVLAGLVYLFLWESGISFAAESLANVSLFRIGLSAYAGMVDGAPIILDDVLGSLSPGPGGAALKAAVIAVLAVGGAASLLARRDLAAPAE